MTTSSIPVSSEPGRRPTAANRVPGVSLALGALLLLLTLLRATAAAPIPSPTPPGTVVHWLFSPDRLQGSKIKPVAGNLDIVPQGIQLTDDPAPARVDLSGRNASMVAASDLSKAGLPKQDISVEAWVRVDQPLEWGGIVGAIQDNGESESGWLLGYRNDRFCFALASQEGNSRLTYLEARETFQPRRWYHVVGTYDGREQRVYVNGTLAARDAIQSGPIRYPAQAALVLGAYKDDDEHYPLTGALHEALILRRVLPAAEIAQRFAAKSSQFPEPAPDPIWFTPAYGPFVDWVDRTTAVVSWETDVAMPSALEVQAPDGTRHRLENAAPSTQHVITLQDLSPNSEYFYRLQAPGQDRREVQTRRYLFDTSFYYAATPSPAPAPGSATSHPEAARIAELLLLRSSVRHGYCLVLGAADGAVAVELARQSDLDVVVVESDPVRVQAVRRQFDEAGIQGVRASVHQVAPGKLPYGDYLANLIVSETTLADGQPPRFPAAEVARVLRPSGGVLLLGIPAPANATTAPPPLAPEAWRAWLGDALPSARFTSDGGSWLFHRRGGLEGAGEWTHQYGNPDNTSCSQDELVRGELQVSWWGDPGPRPMPDRGPRNPAPVSRDGRLFIQGDRVLFGLDSYNGTILWSRSAPELRRANVPRDSSNMAAAGDRLYLAHGRYCLALDGDTGRRVQRYSIPHVTDPAAHDWGYLALLPDLIVGSRVRSASRYLGDEGEWYEDYAAEQVSRVTSDRLFGVDLGSGDPRWEYIGGAILNSTITVGDGMIFLIESRAPEAVAAAGTRLPPETLTDTHLVALDLRSGRKLWSKAHDFSACQFMTYLVYSRNTVVVTGTDKNKAFHTFAFNAPAAGGSGDVDLLASGGQVLWSESHQEDKGHHSGHLQHPVVIDDVFYSDQRAFRLSTGETLRKDLPERRGCGTMSASRHALFFRHYYHGMWDLETDRRTQFDGVRSGCWLTLIPSGGLLLAPESSAGCSCTHPIQTSMGFVPKTRTASVRP
ncbi:MAG: LamG-like jellyroll fold domain-containing protein [Limisphaerales bacterium]